MILKPYNFFIYNKNNFKKINKILFKKNKEFRKLLFQNHILNINNINIIKDCEYFNIKLFDTKYLI